jgi:hypothetical protein
VDDRPFFFSLVSLESARQKKYGAYGSYPLQHGRALALLVGLLEVSVVIVALVLITPHLLGRTRLLGDLSRPSRFGINLYFLAIGFGYLLVEIPLMQRLILFLGHPVYAFTVALFAMLVSSGIGSMVVKAIPLNFRRTYLLLFFLSVFLTALVSRFLPNLLHQEIGLPLAARIAIAVVVVAPIGFLLGIPFPTGLSIVAEIDPRAVGWAWAMNGAASVAAPVLAMISAIQWGFTVTLYWGAICYLAASLLYFLVLSRVHTIARRPTVSS